MKLATAPVRPLIIVTAGLAAVGTAAVLVLPRLVITPQARPAATAAAPEGAYWHTRVLTQRQEDRRLGSGANQYWVVQPRVSETWTTPDGRTWFGTREPGVYPASAADKAAWRRDGSPTRWRRTANGQVVRLSTQPDQGRVTPVQGQQQFFLAGQWLTYEEVQRLPADPNGLKSWLGQAGRVARAEENALDRFVTSALPSLLHELPAPKEVRTAAYQALLTMPGVHAKGTATDGVGRTGAAVSIDDQNLHQKGDAGRVMTRNDLIIDTGTMLLLSQTQTTTTDDKLFRPKTYTQIVLQAGWTDAQPAVPALPTPG